MPIFQLRVKVGKYKELSKTLCPVGTGYGLKPDAQAFLPLPAVKIGLVLEGPQMSCYLSTLPIPSPLLDLPSSDLALSPVTGFKAGRW